MTDAIRTEGDAALLVKLERLKSLQHARAGLLAGGKHIRSLMAEEPAERHVPQPFKTDKQRRGFFAKLRKGEIEVPYRRGRSPGAKGLSKSWHLDVEDDGNRVVVSTNVPYARVVQDEDYAKYSHYHKATGWPTKQKALREELPAILKYVKDGLDKDLAS